LDFAHPQGKTITDLSGHQHHGTIRGASWLVRDDDSVTMPATKLVVAGPFGPRLRHARRDRQEVKFEFPNLQVYTRQLDFFKIELGAVGGGKNYVEYASELPNETPIIRTGLDDKERRMYMVPQPGNSDKFDKQLLRKTGVDLSDRLVVKFFPAMMEEQMAIL
jgi:hypothetical protein